MTERVPYEPDVVTWTTMLGACRKWGNLELGWQAFQGAANLDDNEATPFVLLSNMYAEWQLELVGNEVVPVSIVGDLKLVSRHNPPCLAFAEQHADKPAGCLLPLPCYWLCDILYEVRSTSYVERSVELVDLVK
ncbi:hypothetical protein GOP47_0028601 [Adiantum capillus-veneris]|nr:hypothetical protein GOP47_0028601 [Adiantum capillus-veneris]